MLSGATIGTSKPLTPSGLDRGRRRRGAVAEAMTTIVDSRGAGRAMEPGTRLVSAIDNATLPIIRSPCRFTGSLSKLVGRLALPGSSVLRET